MVDRDKRVVLHEELPVLLVYDDQGLRIRAVLRSRGGTGDELDVVADTDDLATGVGFDVTLGDLA